MLEYPCEFLKSRILNSLILWCWCWQTCTFRKNGFSLGFEEILSSWELTPTGCLKRTLVNTFKMKIGGFYIFLFRNIPTGLISDPFISLKRKKKRLAISQQVTTCCKMNSLTKIGRYPILKFGHFQKRLAFKIERSTNVQYGPLVLLISQLLCTVNDPIPPAQPGTSRPQARTLHLLGRVSNLSPVKGRQPKEKKLKT